MLLTDTQQLFDSPRLSTAVSIAKTNVGGIQTVADTTVKWLNGAIRDLIKFTGDIRIDQLTPQLIYDWHQGIEQRTKAATANNRLRALNIILNRLLKKGFLAQNPAQHVPNFEEPPRQPKAIHPDTYQKLRNHADVRMTAILDLLWASGCRLGELFSIEINTVEFWEDNGRLCFAAIVAGKGRNGRYRGQRQRHIYADSQHATSIQQWTEQRPETAVTNKLFTTFSGQPLSPHTVASYMRQLRAKAKIKSTTIANIHAFRHAFAIRKLDGGYDLAAVSAWLGHADPAFTAKTYLIRTEAQLREKYFRNGR